MFNIKYNSVPASVGLVRSLLVLASVTCLSHASQVYRAQPPSHTPLKHPSDLVHSTGPADFSNLASKSLSYDLENQINDKHAAQQLSKNSPRADINGDQYTSAIYMPPPANFKPIIYEHLGDGANQLQQQQQPLQQQQQQQPLPRQQQPQIPYQQQVGSNDPSAATSYGETFLESPNHLVAAMLPPINGQGSLLKQQQKRQTQAKFSQQRQPQQQQQLLNDQRVAPAESDSDAHVASSEELDSLDSLPMKPSIDRWSDWHDVSVDPDLAASETQLSPASTFLHTAQSDQRQSQLERANQIKPAPFYSGQKHGTVQSQEFNAIPMAIQTEDHARTLQVMPLINQLYHQQHHRQQALAANLIKMQQPSNDAVASHRQKQDYFQHAPQGNLYLSRQQLQGGKVEMHPYHYQQQQQQQHHSYHQRPSPLQQAQNFYYIIPPQQQPPSLQMARSSFVPVGSTMLHHAQLPRMVFVPQPQAPPATNNKKMTNMFKAADENQAHSEAALDGLRRTRKFKSPPASAEVKLVANQQQTRNQLSAPLVLNSQHQDVSSAKQVNANGLIATNRVLSLTNSGNIGQRSTKPVQPLPASVPAQPTNSSLAAKRVLRRRRIKTLTPVGLSSWFLGGIRDLDARHWKLPNDIMSKLAINDVDLQHSEPSSAGESVDDPSSVISISNQVQAGGSLEKAGPTRSTQTRVTTSQISPR